MLAVAACLAVAAACALRQKKASGEDGAKAEGPQRGASMDRPPVGTSLDAAEVL